MDQNTQGAGHDGCQYARIQKKLAIMAVDEKCYPSCELPAIVAKYIFVYIYIHTYTYVYIYVHTYIYIYEYKKCLYVYRAWDL